MSTTALVLGLDAGGTATRWRLADARQHPVAQGEVEGFSATMLGTVQQPLLDTALASLARALRAQAARPMHVVGGLTGFDGGLNDPRGALHAHVAAALNLRAEAITLISDIELAWRAAFGAPGRGILVMAGTGSIAAHLGTDGTLVRAGGRGSLLDDGGSGYWIAREALRWIWRREDEAPGAWRASGLARAVFDALGSADWSRTREFVAGASRGEMGALATAVATAAREGDADARTILQAAGAELARIANALIERCGVQPVALAGRVATLDASIVEALRAALPRGVRLSVTEPDVLGAAIRLAATLAATS